jgi:nicotinamidase-related amidase
VGHGTEKATDRSGAAAARVTHSSNPEIDSPQSLPNWIFPWPAFDVKWKRAALVVIDCQNYCANPLVGLGKMLQERSPEIAAYYLPRVSHITIPNTRRLIDAFRQAERKVIFTRHGALLPDGQDMISRRRRRDTDARDNTGAPAMWSVGSYEHQIVDDLMPLPHELVIDKNASSPFNSTGIDQLLRNMEIETLVVTGIATDMCVENTSRDAADRGYNTIVVQDAVATFFPNHHHAALSALARVFTQVWDTEQVLLALRATLPEGG